MYYQIKSLVLLQIVLTICSYIAQARADFTVATAKKTVCTKNMPCKWAMCPPSDRLIVPSEQTCFIVENDSCFCPEKHTCRLSDTVIPTVTTLQYQYKCMPPTDLPFTRNYFDIRRKKSHASIFEPLNSNNQYAGWDPK